MTNKERLEELKEWFNNDGEIHEFQIEWLIEQAEKVEKLEKDIKFHEIITAKYLALKENN